jgi:two-component system chemotaxis response regulator CheY
MRSREAAPPPDRIQVLLGATDRLNGLVRDPAASNQADISETMAELAKLRREFAAAGTGGASAVERNHPGDKPLRMLLVEDDFTSRFLLQTFLSRYGECHVAVNGKEAVEAFRCARILGQPYDLICMDIMMPEMDGCEAVRQMRAMEAAEGISSTHGVKIVMTTTVHDVKKVMQCFSELCDGYLVKPIDLSELLGHMRSYQLVE